MAAWFCLGCGTGAPSAPAGRSLRQLEIAARRELAEGRPEKGAEMARQILQQAPDSIDGLIVAGYAAASLRQFDQAVEFYARIPDDNTDPQALEGRCLLAQLQFFDLGQADAAETQYRRILSRDPNHGLAHQGLATLMESQGRRAELIPHMLQAIRAGRTEVGNLLALGWAKLPSANPQVLKLCRTAVPDDPLPLLGLARIAARQNDLEQAEKLLRELIEVRPGQIEAQGLLGRILADSPVVDAWPKWHAQLPGEAENGAEIWYARGVWLEHHQQTAAATRCFAECCRRDADHPEANYRLYRLLLQAGRPEQAQPFLERSQQLEDLGRPMALVHARQSDTGSMQEIARRMESLGRIWEAWGWMQIVAAATGHHAAVAETQRLRRLLVEMPLERTQPAFNPALKLDLAHYPLPDFQRYRTPESTASPAVETPQVRFEDYAAAAGIDFSYFNGRPPGEVGLRLHEAMGGGVAVLDYDGDYWPDVYLPQGCDMHAGSSSQHRDRLFRNRGDGRFDDVTDGTVPGRCDFGQGSTAGDFNDDGFPDVYVANAGINRLYRNNGDGTFTDVSADRGPPHSYWTTSVAMADVNGDGWPDLYDCTYLAGPDLYTRVCVKNGLPRACSPLAFAAERDRLYLNQGDGRFEEIGATAGLDGPNGKGLGVVAADFDGSGRLSLFVANDLEANSFFVNESSPGTLRPGFVDRAPLNGLAFDSDGSAQACMGVAAGDADGDSRLDLFVTNYHLESNTLYCQADGQFQDRTRYAGLRNSSFSMLGFGTQFLDFDLDGAQDLVVTNGHLDDFSHEGVPFRMPLQAFRNLGAGRFAELPASSLGACFQVQGLGRGLARLDWNRDGAEDFAVSYLDRPLALPTNRTERRGNFLAMSLRGVQSSRDAIGTTVTVTVGQRTLVRQLTAGDGYMASNERQLIFGLADAVIVDRVEIRWPAGLRQSLPRLDANQHVVVVEGRAPTPVSAQIPDLAGPH